jgi:multidrug efflux system membrane fusion protein
MSVVEKLTSRPWIIAVLITAAVVLWLATGALAPDHGEPVAVSPAGNGAEPVIPRVQVSTRQAQPITRYLSIYGRTAPARVVELKAETNGRVAAIGLQRGYRARDGQLLVELDLRDRQARLGQARASVAEHQTAYSGQLELRQQGYVSETQLAQTLAQLESAKAELLRAELDLEYMKIRTPFAGVLQDRTVEVGDFVRAGDPVATFVDDTSLIVTGSVAEQDAGNVREGGPATALLVTGQEARGRIRYVAPVADESTRTFTVELEIPNPDGSLPAGVTAEMRIPAGEVMAHRVSPALLSLDADGKLVVKTVGELNQVVFHPVEIARSETGGVWVTGLPEKANIIVVGQGYVSRGQTVSPVEAQAETALAETAGATPADKLQ